MNTLSQRATSEKERFAILDILRGFALVGIALANFPEFGLWTFLSGDEQAAMPSATYDWPVLYLEYIFVDGKFYTIFSFLFGIGFSLFLSRHGKSLFLRRMLILMFIGAAHMMFLWSGDILLLYSVAGILLMLLSGLSDRLLTVIACLLIFLPVGLDAITEFCGIDYAAPFYRLWWHTAASYGIDENNFASWLRDADCYGAMFAFLVQGACERMWEFVSGHRLPKVLGLFILGYLAGKHRLYLRLDTLPLRRILLLSMFIGWPLSAFYAGSAVSNKIFGPTIHSLLYALSVIPMAINYIALIALLYQEHRHSKAFLLFSATGRMALSCYISQSVVGIILFYGIGFSLGTTFSFCQIELTALAVYLLQAVFCLLWLRFFRFGLLEWLWRCATYRHRFPLFRSAQ